MQKFKNIVFDLGGVIITLDHQEALRRFKEIGVERIEEFLDPYLQKGIFLDLEAGRLSKQAFYEALRNETGKNLSDAEIDYGWLGFIKDVPVEKLTMLETLRKNYKLYLLSNTNPVVMTWAHSPAFSSFGKSIDEYFDKLYLSFEIGMLKPDRKIFEFVIEDSGINPAETLFIDDGVRNIEAAKQCGMNVYLAKNGEDLHHLFLP
ncbi:MAG: HAD family phosphatase [Dysgonamonadaceae bacterium]|jgi:putative hydrolase of the HAD superfamily|nr:HAD family phosphatase [Dysgonamonadaceae bacterium]